MRRTRKSASSSRQDDAVAEESPAKKPRRDPNLRPFATVYFEELVAKAGLVLAEETSNHILKCEPLAFLDELKSILENNVDYPRNVGEFIKGFENRTEGDELDSFLACNVSVVSNDEIETRVIQNSVLRLLLNVTCLQENIVEYAICRATQYAIANKPDKVQMLLKPFILLDNLTTESKLAKGLIDLLDVSERPTRLEIITCLPDIVTPSEHQNVALELCRFMLEDYELTPAVLDCLSYFCLPSDLKMQVRDKMLTMLRTSAPLHLFPNLVNFFLIGYASEHCTDIIHGLRDGLDWTSIGNQSNVDVSTSQVMTILSLKSSLMKSKTLSTDWLKVINGVKETNDHKPLDVIVLLIINSLKNGKEKLVENAFRKKIKASLFTSNIINICLKKFKPIMKEYIFEILQICSMLLKSKLEPSFKDFSIHWFRCMFAELADVRRTIVNELVNNEYIEERDSLANSMLVLSKIGDDDIELLKPFSLQILALINKTDILNSSEISQIMNLLCNLAFSIENSVLQDDVHMLIRKQLSSSDLSIKSRGIAGGVMAIKHIVCSKTESVTKEGLEYSQISDLPDGASKEAALIIELITKSTCKFTEMTCYFYDELANMLTNCKAIDQPFLMWLTNTVTNDFQNSFIIDVKDKSLKSIDNIELSLQFCLDSIEDVEEPIALNIGNIALGHNPDNLDLRLLPSWFRVLQLLHKKGNEDDLSAIDALLGCAVIMPVITDETSLEEFNPDFFEVLLNCYVHCINWFRELISAFSSQTESSMRKKVLQRIDSLVKLEKQLAIYINSCCIDYKPPVSTFIGTNLKVGQILMRELKAKKPKSKPKSKKKNPVAETSILQETLKTQEDKSPDKSSQSKFRLNPSFFRQLQFDCIELFNEELNIERESEDVSNGIDLDSFLLLLEEITPTIASIFPTNKVKLISNFSKSTKPIFIPLNLDIAIDRSIALIPRLFQQMDSISKYVTKNLDANDGIRDALSMFSEQNMKAQLCLANLFNVFSLILSWSGFHLIENKQKIINIFKTMAINYDPNNKSKQSLKEHVTKFSSFMSNYKDLCLLISTAANLVKLFEVIVGTINDKEVKNMLVNLSRDFLSLSWKDELGNIEKGLHYNQHVDTLLTGYFSVPNIEKIKSLTEDLKEQCPELTTKNSVLGIFECINKANFPLLFRSMSRALYEATKNDIDKGLTDKQHLDLWRNVAIIMKNFTEILKTMDGRSNLAAFLKKSIPLFKLFSMQGMPMMDLRLKTDPDSVVEILRTLQHSTRFLHSLYCHLRLTKDTSLIAYLPQMKLTLETLVYKVKASLMINNCSEAFWMGNLKNKNLQGELIPSQSTVNGDSDGEEDDQLPEDEHSMSEGDDDNDDMKSVSSIY